MSDIFEIELPEQFTIATVMSISEKMFESFKSGAKEVSIKANNVARADTAALQLLQSFAQTAKKEHMSFNINDPTDSFIRSIEIIGLKGLILSN